MSDSRLIELSYFDPGKQVRFTTYADTIITEPDGKNNTFTVVRFGGYPEIVRAMSDAIYGGAAVEAKQVDKKVCFLNCIPKSYRRQLGHDGVYATATLINGYSSGIFDLLYRLPSRPTSGSSTRVSAPRESLFLRNFCGITLTCRCCSSIPGRMGARL